MMHKRIAVAVPVYLAQPDKYELFSLRRMADLLVGYDVFFVCPEGLDISFYTGVIPWAKRKSFAQGFFSGLKNYNRLMMSVGFYESFEAYEYVLICQLDVLLLKFDIETYLNLNIDYIGGMLPIYIDDKYRLFVGNGGFSLRRCSSTRSLLMNHKKEADNWIMEEDEFFSFMGRYYPNEYVVADQNMAMMFCFDRYVEYLYEKTGNELPMAIHGWYKRDVSSVIEKLRDILPDIESILPDISNEKALDEIDSFVRSNDRVLLYGAGDWGHCFCRYAESKDMPISGFVVSDGQQIEKSEYHGKHIYHLSEVPGGIENYSVVVTLGRYHRPVVGKVLRSCDVENVYMFSETICDAVGSYLLKHKL